VSHSVQGKSRKGAADLEMLWTFFMWKVSRRIRGNVLPQPSTLQAMHLGEFGVGMIHMKP